MSDGCRLERLAAHIAIDGLARINDRGAAELDVIGQLGGSIDERGRGSHGKRFRRGMGSRAASCRAVG